MLGGFLSRMDYADEFYAFSLDLIYDPPIQIPLVYSSNKAYCVSDILKIKYTNKDNISSREKL